MRALVILVYYITLSLFVFQAVGLTLDEKERNSWLVWEKDVCLREQWRTKSVLVKTGHLLPALARSSPTRDLSLSWIRPSPFSSFTVVRHNQIFPFSKKNKTKQNKREKVDEEVNSPVNHFSLFNFKYRHCFAHTVQHTQNLKMHLTINEEQRGWPTCSKKEKEKENKKNHKCFQQSVFYSWALWV